MPGGEETASGVLQLRRPGPDNAGDSHLYVVSAAGYEPGILQIAAADFASARERELHLAPLDRVVRGRVVSNTGQVVPGVAVWASSSNAARHASGLAVANVTRGVYRTVSGEAGRSQLPCSGRYVSLQVREPAWMDISSLHGRVRGQLYELWARTRGVLVGPETDEVELVVAQPRFIAVRLVDQWGDPVQAQARVTLVDGRFVLTECRFASPRAG